MSPTAIPTRYAGTEFRSRLEARWAAFFDLVGWQWEYEPIDLPGWIPDFMLIGKTNVLVEIKPTDSIDGFDLNKIDTALVAGHDGRYPEVLLLGRGPDVGTDEYHHLFGWLTGPEFGRPVEDDCCYGLPDGVRCIDGRKAELPDGIEWAEIVARHDDRRPGKGTYGTWCHGAVIGSGDEGADFGSSHMSYQGRLTGWYDGNSLDMRPLSRNGWGNQGTHLKYLWREAGNITRWKRPRVAE